MEEVNDKIRQLGLDDEKKIVQWLEAGFPVSDSELLNQRQNTLSQKVCFSILTPLYNTPLKFLNAMIASVAEQTYECWELCLADGSDAEHPEVEAACREWCAKDSRIRYQRLEENLGIAGNTNACIDMATGDYLALLDHDDLLHPFALYEYAKEILNCGAELLYSDEATFVDRPDNLILRHFKPDYAPDTLRGNNYICHFLVFSRELMIRSGSGLRSGYDGGQDHDLILRFTEQTDRIAHIKKIMYYWRASPRSTALSSDAKPYAAIAGCKAVEDHLKRVGLDGEVSVIGSLTIYRVKYRIRGNPLISVIIPTCEAKEILARCVSSILEKTTYTNYEIILVENNSRSEEIFAYYEELEKDPRIRVVRWSGAFNYSSIINFGASFARGEHLLFLNNDTEVITPDWMQEMLMFSQREDVGLVGAKLYYPNDTIQHAGVGIGVGPVAGHYHQKQNRDSSGYMGRLLYAQDLSAVTGACTLMRRSVFEEVGGYNEAYRVSYNDIDFSLRIRAKGYLVVFTPFAELYHHESASRGPINTPETIEEDSESGNLFRTEWEDILAKGDPYFNPNFVQNDDSFRCREDVVCAAPYRLGEKLEGNMNGRLHSYAVNGLSVGEDWGAWTDGAETEFLFLIDGEHRNLMLRMDYVVFRQQTMKVYINDNLLAEGPASEMHTLVFPGEWVRGRKVNVKLVFPDAASPASAKTGKDIRVLALGIINLTIKSTDRDIQDRERLSDKLAYFAGKVLHRVNNYFNR